MYTRTLLTALLGCSILAGCEAPGSVPDVTPGTPGVPTQVNYTRDFGPARRGGGPAGDLIDHGGPVLTTNKTQAIFWGSSWATDTTDKIPGLDSFFSGFGGSGIESLASEYSGIQNVSTYLGHTIDTSAVSTKALTTSQAVAEACKITNNSPDPTAVYFLYTLTGAGQVSYCAWHSYGNCPGTNAPVQVAYMPNIDGQAGCDPQDTWTTHSQGLAALANVTSHELMEAITDPRITAWYDSAGAENGDKCAWSFHNVVTLKNGSQWKLQMEWSNYAYDHSTGYANRSGQLGCLQD